MKKTNKFSPEVRERAVRMVQEQRGDYPSLWAAIESIAPKIGCVPQTLNEWVIRAVTDDVQEDGESPGGLAYRVEAGVFKRICDDAKRDKVSEAQVGIRPDATVWKMSIEEAASDGVTRNYCFNHGEARIGWENAGDLLTQNFEKMAELGGKGKKLAAPLWIQRAARGCGGLPQDGQDHSGCRRSHGLVPI